MSTNIEEKIERETWEVLQQLKQDLLLTHKSRYVLYEVVEKHENDAYPTPNNQRKIIEKFELLGVLKIIKINYLSSEGSVIDSPIFAIQGVKPKGFLVDIIGDSFEKIFVEYEKRHSLKNTFGKNLGDIKYYITKKNDNFSYNGKLLNLRTKNDVYKVFCSLYAHLPEGGKIDYKNLGKEIKSRIPKTKNYSEQKMRKFISANLTDRSNGFVHYAHISETEDNGKPLISTVRAEGIIFNNRAG